MFLMKGEKIETVDDWFVRQFVLSLPMLKPPMQDSPSMLKVLVSHKSFYSVENQQENIHETNFNNAKFAFKTDTTKI